VKTSTDGSFYVPPFVGADCLLEKCIALDPNWMPAYFNLALLIREEDEEEARTLFEKAIELDFNELPVW
jgi:tetratricopeptide (TPR) repeat protein